MRPLRMAQGRLPDPLLAMDDLAASPLTVIAVVAVAAAVLAGGLVWYFADEEPAWQVQPAPPDAGPGFVVVDRPGGVRWSDVEVQLVNAAGTDRASVYLVVPEGEVERGQELRLRNDPPAGPYLLRILDGGREVARATVVL
jgi:hypothetical protein